MLAASDCGIIPFRSEMRTIDVWRLTGRREFYDYWLWVFTRRPAT